MSAVPALIAVTLPSFLPTMATALFELENSIALSVASLGATVGFKVAVLPVSSHNAVLSSDTPVTGCTLVLNDNAVLLALPA